MLIVKDLDIFVVFPTLFIYWKGKESFDYEMNCKSHLHLGKFKNFLVCTFFKIQDFCIFPIRLQTKQKRENLFR